MAVRKHYSWEKRQKELNKKNKKEEKIRRRTEKKEQTETGADSESGQPEQEE